MARPATSVVGNGSGRPSTAAVRLLAGNREPCRLAGTGNIDILTGGLVTIDGIVPAAGDRVVLGFQADPKQNGIYTASPGPWWRATDARSPRAVTLGVQVRVQEGVTHALSLWEFRSIKPRIGTDAISIVKLPFQGGGFGIFDMKTIGGTANALTATFEPTFTARRVGQLLHIRTTQTNTGAMTINPDGFGAIAMKMPDGSAIPADAVQANTDYILRDDGTDLRIFLSNITF
jgi:hypothetical protein